MGAGGEGGLGFREQRILEGFDGNLKGVHGRNCEEDDGAIRKEDFGVAMEGNYSYVNEGTKREGTLCWELL